MKLVALIMAGGGGKRFWPLSTPVRPKQFLTLWGGKSMLRMAFERVLPLIPREDVYVVTQRIYASQILDHLPELPEKNVILEPTGKNTAPCIALGAARIAALEPDAVMVVLPSDHAIGSGEEFIRALVAGCHVAEMKLRSGRLPLITFGVKPVIATSGYGYIKCGDVFAVAGGFVAKFVTNFVEKPAPPLAQAFFEEGSWLWNSGIFVWKVSSILREFMDLVPEWRGYIERMLAQGGMGSSVEEFYEAVQPAQIDKLILERSTSTLAIPVSFGWSDIGSWEALDGFLRRSLDENIKFGEVAMIDCSGCLAIADKGFVGIIGVKDVVVVSSGDAVLVIDKKRSQEVEKISRLIEKKTI